MRGAVRCGSLEDDGGGDGLHALGLHEIPPPPLYLQSFAITCSSRFGDCFYSKLLPEYATFLGCVAAASNGKSESSVTKFY